MYNVMMYDFINMMFVMLMNMLVIYIALCEMTTYDVSCMKQSTLYGLLSCVLDYVGLKGFT